MSDNTFTRNQLLLIEQLVGQEHTVFNGNLKAIAEEVAYATHGFDRWLEGVKSKHGLQGGMSSYWWPDEVRAALGWSPQKLGGVVRSLEKRGDLSLTFVTAKQRAAGDDDNFYISPLAIQEWAFWWGCEERDAKAAVRSAMLHNEVLAPLGWATPGKPKAEEQRAQQNAAFDGRACCEQIREAYYTMVSLLENLSDLRMERAACEKAFDVAPEGAGRKALKKQISDLLDRALLAGNKATENEDNLLRAINALSSQF